MTGILTITCLHTYCEERGVINSKRMLMLSLASAVDVSVDSAGPLSLDAAFVDPSEVTDGRFALGRSLLADG
jgi:hypothetical protein